MCRLTVLLLVVLPTILGCNSAPRPVQAWVAANGGTLHDRRLDRARALADVMLASRADVRVEISILNRNDLTAFSWPSGHVFLARGLVDALDDELLSAAIAHEIAHILKHGSGEGVSALRSASVPLDVEATADRMGVALLAACGTPPDAMERMLCRILREDGLAPRVQNDLRRRVELLRAILPVKDFG
jgi:predicted Zn-dependent protease